MTIRASVLATFNLSYDKSVETGSWLDILVSAVDNAASLDESGNLALPGDLSVAGKLDIGGTATFPALVVPGPSTLGDLAHGGPLLAFHASPPAPKLVVAGAKGGNVALGALMTVLSTIGLVIDTTGP